MKSQFLFRNSVGFAVLWVVLCHGCSSAQLRDSEALSGGDRFEIYQLSLLKIAEIVDKKGGCFLSSALMKSSTLQQLALNKVVFIHSEDDTHFDSDFLETSDRNVDSLIKTVGSFKIPKDWAFELPNRRIHVVSDVIHDKEITLVRFSRVLTNNFDHRVMVAVRISCSNNETMLAWFAFDRSEEGWAIKLCKTGFETD